MNKNKQGRKLYIDAGKDLKIHKISKRVTLLILLRKIELEMLPHLKTLELKIVGTSAVKRFVKMITLERSPQ